MVKDYGKKDGINFGTLNVRGCKSFDDRREIISELKRYDLQILGLSETHVGETILEEFKTKEETFSLFLCGKGSYHGVGLVVNQALKPKFKKISDRICTADIEFAPGKQGKIISAYAPTLSVSEKTPKEREDFYDQLREVCKSVSRRKPLYLLGDFNAKTGSSHADYPEAVGKYGKGATNSNGEALLQFATEFDLVLTNTLFDHPMRHRTTWEAPERHFSSAKDAAGNPSVLLGNDGEPRRNPFRNQIDYILVRNNYKRFVKDSRSYGGCKIETDHKLVRMRIDVNWLKVKTKKVEKEPKVNMSCFTNPIKQQQYKDSLNVEHLDLEDCNSQEKWTALSKHMYDCSLEIMGTVTKSKKYSDSTIKELSNYNNALRKKLSSVSNMSERKNIRNVKRGVRNAIRKRKSEIETDRLNDKLLNLESVKNDCDKYYRAIRELKQNTPKQSLCVFDDDNLIVGTEEEQVVEISKHFQRVLGPDDVVNTKHYPPTPMIVPFNSNEIDKAAKSMPNGKACGIDRMHAEHVKYANDVTHDVIAQILNETAETGNYPEEIKIGILTPLPKPGKAKGPRENLRPIILLSIIRKILTICLIKRIWDRLSQLIGKDQAAYQSNRSTTEQVFAIKVLAEKAIGSSDFRIYILMLDMSKAFDTVNRNRLFTKLETILNLDELHLLDILTNDVFLRVKVGDTIGDAFKTLIGIMQGDCLSAILFIFYLACALTPPPQAIELSDHNYEISSHSTVKWKYVHDNQLCITPKYADDVTWATTDMNVITEIESTVPAMLTNYELQVNISKTEKFAIPSKEREPLLCEHSYSRKPDEDEWKNMKLLGSFIDTDKDIAHRKCLLIGNMKNNRSLYSSKLVSMSVKLRHFDCYQTSIFLYNCGLWTLNNSQELRLDAFHRRQLRYAIGFVYPKLISNEELYRLTKQIPWSAVCRERRLKLLGHIMRLHEQSPAAQAFSNVLQPAKAKIGRPKLTWLKLITQDLINYMNIFRDPNFNNVKILCQNRDQWRTMVGNLRNAGSPAAK